MITNKNPEHSGRRNFTKQQFKAAWRDFRQSRASVASMPWWLASVCFAVDKNCFAVDPLLANGLSRLVH